VKKRPGLTLVDLMVSLAVLAIIMSAVYWVFATQEKAVRAANEGRDVYGQARLILDRLTRDITSAWLPQVPRPMAVTQYRFKGQADRLDFISTASMSPDSIGSGLSEIGYRLETPERDAEGRFLIIRRQDDTPDGEPEEGGAEIVLSREVLSLKLTYLDASAEEKEEAEAEQAQALPRAVVVRLELAAPDGGKEIFSTLIKPVMAWPLVRPIEKAKGLKLPW